MATCQTEKWTTYSPYVKLTVTQSDSDETTATLSWTLQYISDYPASTNGSGRSYTVTIDGDTVKSGTYDVDGVTGTKTIASGTKKVNKTTSSRSVSFGVSFTFQLTWSGVYKGTATGSGNISISAKTLYTISYNANGGSGAPSSQTKWHGTNITLSGTKPTRTGYSFQGWGTSTTDTSVDYAAGAMYSTNASDTLYAIWKANTYTVKYNANGGSGAPSNQTKTHDTTLKLSSTVPTRTNYAFKGWATSSSASIAEYAAGANYTKNASVTLYAVWQLAYKNPTITNLVLERCSSDGTPADNGTHLRIKFDWTTFLEVVEVFVIVHYSSGGGFTVDAQGTSDSVDEIVDLGGATEESIEVNVSVEDRSGSFSVTKISPGPKYPIDVLAGGKGVAFGKPAEIENTAEFQYDAKFNGSVSGKVLGMDKVVEIPQNANLNDYINTGCYAIYQNTIAETITNGPGVFKAGRLEVWSATGEGIRSERYSYIRQRYVPYDVNYPTYERDLYRGSDNVWVPTTWRRINGCEVLWSGVYYMSETQTVTLSKAISDQPTGIELVFSMYTDGASENINFHHFFVSKEYVAKHNGKGSSFFMMNTDGEIAANKYLYIHDTHIIGYSKNNDAASVGAAGITLTNNRFVLRYVIGV